MVSREYVAAKGSIAALLVDGTHIKARKGGACTGPSPVDRGKTGSELTVLTDEDSIPICATFCSGNTSDMTQLPIILDEAQRVHGNLTRFNELLADKGYDSTANRIACLRHGLQPLILQRRRRAGPNHQANANQRRRAARPPVVLQFAQAPPAQVARRRNPVERCFAWQDNHRRVERRQEHRAEAFRAMQYLSLSVLVYDRLEQMGVHV